MWFVSIKNIQIFFARERRRPFHWTMEAILDQNKKRRGSTARRDGNVRTPNGIDTIHLCSEVTYEHWRNVRCSKSLRRCSHDAANGPAASRTASDAWNTTKHAPKESNESDTTIKYERARMGGNNMMNQAMMSPHNGMMNPGKIMTHEYGMSTVFFLLYVVLLIIYRYAY